MILRQIKDRIAKVEIEYKRVVRRNGNKKALKLINEVFEPCDKMWRGIGLIPDSGLKLRKDYEKFDAIERFGVKLRYRKELNKGCRCGDIMKGEAKPSDCKYFKKRCTPSTPIGPCMVSIEGACNIAFRYGE